MSTKYKKQQATAIEVVSVKSIPTHEAETILSNFLSIPGCAGGSSVVSQLKRFQRDLLGLPPLERSQDEGPAPENESSNLDTQAEGNEELMNENLENENENEAPESEVQDSGKIDKEERKRLKRERKKEEKREKAKKRKSD